MFPTAIMISFNSMILPNPSLRDPVPSTVLPLSDQANGQSGDDALGSGHLANQQLPTSEGVLPVSPSLAVPMPPAPTVKADFVNSRCDPWLSRLVYPLGRHVVLPFYFEQIEVIGRHHLPQAGPVILAPTHRSRWDALMIPYAAGQDITGRELRFMVTVDEVRGLQGWFIRRLGGFAINTKHPEVASLRHGIEILQNQETLVIFPEGGNLRENRCCALNKLHPGLARLALKAEASQADLGIQIVPIATSYSHPSVPWRSRVKIQIGQPLRVADYGLTSPKAAAKQLTNTLQTALQTLIVA
jgi:1-acyl-sn-glycerol-3-phosphate acyltransferase